MPTYHYAVEYDKRRRPIGVIATDKLGRVDLDYLPPFTDSPQAIEGYLRISRLSEIEQAAPPDILDFITSASQSDTGSFSAVYSTRSYQTLAGLIEGIQAHIRKFGRKSGWTKPLVGETGK